jgi:hypothetical protein
MQMSFLPSPRRRRWSPALVVVATMACTPVFNWREVPVGEGDLVALLPCKPDRAERALPLGAESVRVDMAGCEAGGVTFAIAHAEASGPAQAQAWLDAWRAATRRQLAGRELTESPASLPRASAAPAALRLDARGDAARKPAMASARVLWFARQHPRGVSLYQATAIGEPSAPDALETFFEGLRLPATR